MAPGKGFVSPERPRWPSGLEGVPWTEGDGFGSPPRRAACEGAASRCFSPPLSKSSEWKGSSGSGCRTGPSGPRPVGAWGGRGEGGLNRFSVPADDSALPRGPQTGSCG